jgi:hypothetical protein
MLSHRPMIGRRGFYTYKMPNQTKLSNLFSLAALKLCIQADSFEYNYIEFEYEICWTPRRAMSDLNGKICYSSAHFQWHSNKTKSFVYVSTLVFF